MDSLIKFGGVLNRGLLFYIFLKGGENMRKYEVIITETLQRVVEYEANSKEEAIEAVKGDYRLGEIILDESDFKEVTFK